MSALDGALPPLAESLVRQFGKSVVLTYPGADPVYDPTTGQTIGGEPVEVEARAIVEAYPDAVARGGETNTDSIQRGDLKATLAADELEDAPTIEVTVTADGKTYTVVTVDPVYTGERIALYVLQLRR